MVGRSVCHDFLKRCEVTLPCSYRSTCSKFLLFLGYAPKHKLPKRLFLYVALVSFSIKLSVFTFLSILSLYNYRSAYRGKEQRLTREAMKKYLHDRGDMVVVMLHAKVHQQGVRYIVVVMLQAKVCQQVVRNMQWDTWSCHATRKAKRDMIGCHATRQG